MNIYKLKKRYRKSDAEISRALSEHLEKLGSYASFQYGAWEMDEKGLPILDDIMGYKELSRAQEETTPQNSREAQEPSDAQQKNVPAQTAAAEKVEAKQSITPEEPMPTDSEQNLEDAKDARIKELTGQVEEARNVARQYANELNTLQEKFISVQNGSDALNSSLIRKHQLRAEAAEAQLTKLQKDFSEKNRLKLERIKELEGRIEEMQTKLIENHDELERRQKELFDANEKLEALKKDSTERCSQAELKVLNSKKNEDKLYRDLHKSDERISELNQKVVAANNERLDALQRMSSMRGQITDLKSQLITIVANLNEYLTDNETIPDAAGKTVKPPKEQVSSTEDEIPHLAPPTPPIVAADDTVKDTILVETPPAAAEKPAPDITLSLQQNELLEKLRKEQQEETKEETKGFFSKIFGKAAGFF